MNDPRRKFLIKALRAGLYSIGVGSSCAYAGFFGKTPEKLAAGKSFYKIEGQVRVNGKAATEDTLITADDTIETLDGSKAIFVVGQDAFLLRQRSKLKLSGKSKIKQLLKKNKQTTAKVTDTSPQPINSPAVVLQTSSPANKTVGEFMFDKSDVVNSLRLMTGAVLTVFGKTTHQIKTVNAIIGIRGTGVYFEAEPRRSYVCTCYGITEIEALNDPDSLETIRSKHHDAPRYILTDANDGERIIPAPFKNHSDLELMLLEEIVGRVPPFSVSGDNYNAPRRGY
ncbi:MAG: hypothetical protein KZQ83_09125 [gamma proteobacterium symbiont of Taylorina sp.]|nr:hypothetical protein [gamma proteobacterium symbiont of Taylorina sp.]